jgi:hypothetical protein
MSKKITQKKLACENHIIDYLLDKVEPQTFGMIVHEMRRKAFGNEDVCWCLEDLIKQGILSMVFIEIANGHGSVGYKYEG